MTTLAEAFLADLGSEEEEEEEVTGDASGEGVDAAMDVEDDAPEKPAKGLTASDFDDVTSQLKVMSDVRFQEHMEAIKRITGSGSEGVGEEEEYDLLVKSTEWVMLLGDEIVTIHKFARDHYAARFPELEQLVPNSLDYARVVVRIGYAEDMAEVPLEGVLPAAALMVVRLTASTTAGRPLPRDRLELVIRACETALELDELRSTLLEYVAGRMGLLAPNLSAIVGTEVAAKLVGAAGGLMALARLPANNVQVLGSKRKTLQGFSTATTIKHVGFINECDIVKSTPPSLRTKAIRLIAAKCTLAARADCYAGGANAGSPDADAVGKKMRVEIEKRIEKLQEPPPAKKAKPLPAPDDAPRKKRGGKRYRKMKEKYAMSEMRKMANRVAFGEAQVEVGNDGLELGMLGKSKVRAVVSEKRVTKKLQQERSKYGGSASTQQNTGLATSLAFTPVQGFELQDPALMKAKVEEANKKYFSNTGTFTNLKKTKKEGEITL